MDFSQFKKQFNISLNEQQEAAVQATEGPVMLLAVPGSGKTTVLVTRLGYMYLGLGIAPESILTMTYTVAAAGDMSRRFAALFGQDAASLLEFRTINGVSSRIIRHYERSMNRNAFRLLDDGKQKSALIAQLYREQCGEFALESTIRAIETAISYAKNQMLGPQELGDLDVEGLDFPAFYQAYSAALRQQQLMDYDDQMVYALQILRRYPGILEAFRDRYRYLCVDEAQDTSRIQHELIRLLVGDRANLFMVGDEDQSIYGFRGACPQALMDFDTVYPQARVLFLEQNYRSTAEIVAAANSFIRSNTDRRPKQMRSVRGSGPKLREISLYDRQSQYAYLCSMAQNCTVETGVLYRDNESALPLIDLLERRGIAYRCRQVDSLFFTSRVVTDITDIIRFALDPGDGRLFMNIYYKLGAGISKALAQEALLRADGDILEYLATAPGASAWTRKQCKALHTHMEHLKNEQADKAVYRIVNYMGYGAYQQERGGDMGKAEILEALGRQEPSPARLLDRLEELRGILLKGASDASCPFVLSTIHSSKGLEYERVVLMDVADGILPKSIPHQDADEEELKAYQEERRLFYVAMTRAKQELCIFTFKKPGLESAFSKEVFPEKSRSEKQHLPASGSVKKIIQPPRENMTRRGPDQRDFKSGTRIFHKSFGPGILVSRTGDVILVVFDTGDFRRLALSAALRSGQLSLE